MGIQISKSAKLNVPTLTLFILILSAISYFLPGVASFFIYDRAAITKGEFWRLLTSPLVHFSSIHLLYNILAFGVAGWIIEQKHYRFFGLLCTLIAVFISTCLLIMKPSINYYGGLSGLACGSIIYLALFGLREPHPWRLICLLVLFIVPTKIVLESYYNGSILPYRGPLNFVMMPLSHIVGSLVATFLFLYLTIKEKSLKKSVINY